MTPALCAAGNREADFEAGLAGFGLELDFTAVAIGDNAMADNQSQTGAGTDRLSGKKRLENPGLDFGRDTAPIIHDFHDYLIVFDASADADLARALNGIDRVVDEIGPDLIEFAAIGHDARRRGVKGPGDGDVFQ